jgi:hypothetical protein
VSIRCSCHVPGQKVSENYSSSNRTNLPFESSSDIDLREKALAMPDWPRGMNIVIAAAYCGIGKSLLSRDGPKPIKIGAKRLVWLREDLDKWLDRLAENVPASSIEINPWDIDDDDQAAIP